MKGQYWILFSIPSARVKQAPRNTIPVLKLSLRARVKSLCRLLGGSSHPAALREHSLFPNQVSVSPREHSLQSRPGDEQHNGDQTPTVALPHTALFSEVVFNCYEVLTNVFIYPLFVKHCIVWLTLYYGP